ncbi:hypothetical protein BIWAKO_04686 [Bosea sp. BIWAKO-01]|nr:hypothetical protein BIWAKO_04686 [Bosea sp. BIWAKO-01]
MALHDDADKRGSKSLGTFLKKMGSLIDAVPDVIKPLCGNVIVNQRGLAAIKEKSLGRSAKRRRHDVRAKPRELGATSAVGHNSD